MSTKHPNAAGLELFASKKVDKRIAQPNENQINQALKEMYRYSPREVRRELPIQLGEEHQHLLGQIPMKSDVIPTPSFKMVGSANFRTSQSI
ncbi:hypothetical protein D9757_004729 [Collybiopsis confluens]|uniref:Uncharacterized protein n=1 Tax=Collybiopsis confluens TaxID=2823264 RepID=A0A8H5HSC1_9AGAR|nr:hypothetical protein D9757_004729 [Collybiopsis confluens]